MLILRIALLALIGIVPITLAAAPITWSFPLGLSRLACTGLDFCLLHPPRDPAVLTINLELNDPYSSQTIEPSALFSASYSAPFPFLGAVSLVPDLDGAYSYDASTGLATLTLSSYRIEPIIFAGDVLTAHINDFIWEYNGVNALYLGIPDVLAPASAFVGAPIPLPSVFPLFALTVAGIAYRRRSGQE